jgi:hypothetical protein
VVRYFGDVDRRRVFDLWSVGVMPKGILPPPFPRKKSYYQMHECAGYSARVTIEWNIPPFLTEDCANIAAARGEEIADDLISHLGPKTYEMVQAMRGVPMVTSKLKRRLSVHPDTSDNTMSLLREQGYDPVILRVTDGH